MPRPATPPLRRSALHAMQSFLARSGTAKLYVVARGGRGATILMYHSVADESVARWLDPRNHMSPAVFESQMRFLSEHRSVVTLDELLDALREGRTLPAGSVVITFDDGYRDNLEVAAPILKKYGLPATLYLATGFVERGEAQWIDQLWGIFRSRTRHQLAIGAERFALVDNRSVTLAYRGAAKQLLVGAKTARDALLGEIARQLCPGEQAPRLTLTWDEARRMLGCYEGVSIGAHSREHVDLSSHGPDVISQEVSQCVADVTRELGRRVVHFAYPYNRESSVARDVLLACGFESAVASGTEPLVQAGADPLMLPRIEPPTSLARLAFMTSGAYPGLSRALTGRA